MSPKINIALKIVSWAIVGIAVVLAILLYGVRLFGLELYTVLSPSMEPDYPTGSLLYVSDVDPADLRVGDVITFRMTGEMTGTHRIVELVPDEHDPNVVRFRTKGDNNDIVDASLVEFDDVIGEPVFSIPLLGYLATYIQTPPGSVIAIAVGVALVLLVIVIDGITDGKNQKNNKDQNDITPIENNR